MNKNRVKQWVQCWGQAKTALDSVKKDELIKYNYRKNRILVDQMLQWAFEHKRIRSWSGLVDQQKTFIKLLKESVVSV